MGLFSLFEKKHFGKVKVIECKHLKHEHALLSSKEHCDPFVNVYLNHNNHLIGKTEHKKGTVDPVYDEEFSFEFHNDDYLHLHVHHKGSLMNHDLGTAKVHLAILKEGDQDLWLGLDNGQGEVHITLTCHDEN